MKRVVYPKVLVLLFRCSVAPGLAWVTRVIVQFNYCVIVLLVFRFFGKFQFHFLISKFSLLADLKMTANCVCASVLPPASLVK